MGSRVPSIGSRARGLRSCGSQALEQRLRRGGPRASLGFPGGSVVRNPPASAGATGDVGSIPGLARSPGGGNGNPLQYACLETSMDRGAWWATDHGVAKELDTTEHACTYSDECRISL